MTDKYKELRELAQRATPGKWSMARGNGDGWPLIMSGGKIVANVNPESFCSGSGKFIDMPADENARYIAAANPATITALLAERDALLEALENLAAKAELCDGWDFFPDQYLEPAYDAIEAAKRQEEGYERQ